MNIIFDRQARSTCLSTSPDRSYSLVKIPAKDPDMFQLGAARLSTLAVITRYCYVWLCWFIVNHSNGCDLIARFLWGYWKANGRSYRWWNWGQTKLASLVSKSINDQLWFRLNKMINVAIEIIGKLPSSSMTCTSVEVPWFPTNTSLPLPVSLKFN